MDNVDGLLKCHCQGIPFWWETITPSSLIADWNQIFIWVLSNQFHLLHRFLSKVILHIKISPKSIKILRTE